MRSLMCIIVLAGSGLFIMMFPLSESLRVGNPPLGTAHASALCTVDLNKGFNVPHDLAANAPLSDLECFAWKSFVALNWPAVNQNWQPGTRGVPAPRQNFGNSGSNNFFANGGRLVWETYKHKVELFPGSGVPSQSYDTQPNYVYTTNPTVASGVNNKLFNNLDEASQIGQNLIFFPANPPHPAFTSGKINPNQDVQLLFEARMNRVAYDYVVSNEYYNNPPDCSKTPTLKICIASQNTVNYLMSPTSPTPNQPFVSYPMGDMNQSAASFEGAIETKAAWRMLTPAQIASGRYHTATAIYYTGTDAAPVAQNGTFGLVALHIIHKTQNYPYFIFATFEQVDALQTPSGNPTGLYYITTYPSVQYKSNNPNPGPSPPPPPPPVFPNGKLYAAPGLPFGHSGPFLANQYTQPQDVTAQINDLVHAAIIKQNPNSVWQYYKLLGLQSMPSDVSQSPLAPYFYLANVAVETSLPGLQLFQGRIPPPPFSKGFTQQRLMGNTFLLHGTTSTMVDMGGCMGCHAVPQRTGYDFSFILKGGPVSNPDAAGLLQLQAMQKRLTRTARQFSTK